MTLDEETVEVTGFGDQPTWYIFTIDSIEDGVMEYTYTREQDSLIISWDVSIYIDDSLVYEGEVSPPGSHISYSTIDLFEEGAQTGSYIEVIFESETGRDGDVEAHLEAIVPEGESEVIITQFDVGQVTDNGVPTDSVNVGLVVWNEPVSGPGATMIYEVSIWGDDQEEKVESGLLEADTGDTIVIPFEGVEAGDAEFCAEVTHQEEV